MQGQTKHLWETLPEQQFGLLVVTVGGVPKEDNMNNYAMKFNSNSAFYRAFRRPWEVLHQSENATY
jgi:hypothetical protein